jgi:glycosyltransferase involved in cell wall biosynthesis
MFKITVFTPTYNRAYMLGELYNSLKIQTFKDFEWLIIDDGSNDETDKLIYEYIEEGLININYIKKNNGGKHTAINVGVNNSKGELFFVVDSDDKLLNNSLEIINQAWEDRLDKKDCIGIVGLNQYKNKQIIGKTFEKIMEIPFIDIYQKYKVEGDKAIALNTEILKKYKFPEHDDVKFVAESVMLDSISKKYKVKCINNVLKETEYLEDGLTKNKLSDNYVKGMAFSALYCINNDVYNLTYHPDLLLRQYINLYKFSKFGNLDFDKDIKNLYKKALYKLFTPLSYHYYKKLINK